MSTLDELRLENEELRQRLAQSERSAVLFRATFDSFQALIERSSDVVILVGEGGLTLYASPAIEAMLGRPPEFYVGRRFREVVHEEDRALLLAAVAPLYDSRELEGYLELRVIHRDGSTRWLEGTARNFSADPAIRAVVGNLRDVTERKATEEALRQSELRYRRIIETTSDGVWVIDASYTTTFMNARMVEMLRCSVEEAVGQSAFLFTDGEEQMAGMASAAQRCDGTCDLRLRRRDGTDLWTRTRTSFLSSADGASEGAVALVTDVSESRQAEHARARLAAIVESSHDAIFSRDAEGLVTSWNNAAERLFGYTAADVAGGLLANSSIAITLDEIGALHTRVMAGESVGLLDTLRRRKDGTSIELSMVASPMRDSTGRVVGASVIARDLTEQRRIEASLRRTEAQLRQMQKMDAMGSLAGGIAHDFNNLLSVILGYSSFLLDTFTPEDERRNDVEQMQIAGKRATALTAQLLAFSRQQLLEPEVLDLNEVLGHLEPMLRRILGEDVELSLSNATPVGRVEADPGQMEQVLMNLVGNARDAMPRGGRLTIETSDLDVPIASTAEPLGMAAGSYVRLLVSDTGEGMDEATRARIFDPFFTTKPKGKGTGLGLSTVFGIVDQSGGHVRVSSAVGVGTSFSIYLPRTARTARRLTVAPSLPTSLRGSETVLLVEDEEQVRVLARTILRRNGYSVLEAQNAGDALLVSEQFPQQIHLLLTDVVMPRLSGRLLAERITAQRPDTKVLFMSGYTDDAILHHGVVAGEIAFLCKPLTPESLARKVREVLDAPEGPSDSARVDHREHLD